MGELFEKLKNYSESDFLPMHMPGHKRRMGMSEEIYSIDITEIDGFDCLQYSEGILKDAQQRAADLYHSEESYYLVNGSTAGILSAVLGCTTFDGRILIARNCHKSVYHAMVLNRLKASYLYPQSTGDMGINGVISADDVDNALKAQPDIQAVLITSPSYDGMVSDVAQIAEIVHSYGLPLIVDEAHGAHFPFSEYFPKDSVSCGADVVINSLHKTLPSLTQTALIHLNGNLINRKKIRNYLGILQSSSPSYILMASIDNCVDWIAKNLSAFDDFAKELQIFRSQLRGLKKLKLLEVSGMDESKILISVRTTTLNGYELSEILRKEYHIEMEMACGSYVCAITTVADTKENLDRFRKAIFEIDGQLTENKEYTQSKDTILQTESACTIYEAVECEKEDCRLINAAGKISGNFVSLYPPGIPILTPGECISHEIADRLSWYLKNGFEVHGIEDDKIQVLRGKDHG